ncbi:hypothetical protein Tco_0904440 [Tanacetum coccineum]
MGTKPTEDGANTEHYPTMVYHGSLGSIEVVNPHGFEAFADADHAGLSRIHAELLLAVKPLLGDRLWVIELYFVNTEYQLADIFTKALGRERIEFLINKLGMRSFTPDTLKQLADEVDE